MRTGKAPSGMLVEYLPHDHGCHGSRRQYGRTCENGAQSLRWNENFVDDFGRKRDHPALCVRNEGKGMHRSHRHIDQGVRCERQSVTFHRRAPAAALDQQDLVQSCMPVRCELPAVQLGAHFNRLAMNDVRQVAGFAEQVATQDGQGSRSVIHVRFVQVFWTAVHSGQCVR